MDKQYNLTFIDIEQYNKQYNIRTKKGMLHAKFKNKSSNSYLIVDEISNTELRKCHDFKDGNFEPCFGYIDPKRVLIYFDGFYKKGINGPPNHEIYIDFQDEWRVHRHSGTQVFLSNSENRTVLLENLLLPRDILEKRIDIESVKADYSGLIIPITKKILESKIKDIEKDMNEVIKDVFQEYQENAYQKYKESYYDMYIKSHLDDTKKLAKVGGIDIFPELRTLEEYEDILISEYFSSQEILEKILKDTEKEISLNPFPPEIISGEHTSCNFYIIYKIITKINFPNNRLRQRTISLLDRLYLLSKDIAEDAEKQNRIREALEYKACKNDILNKINKLKHN